MKCEEYEAAYGRNPTRRAEVARRVDGSNGLEVVPAASWAIAFAIAETYVEDEPAMRRF